MDYGHETSSVPNGRRRVARYKAHLTTRTVADASPRDHRYIVWDDELTGFGVRISPSGLRSFIVQYRAREGGRRAASRKKVLGHFPALTPARARRSKAKEVLRAVDESRSNGEGGALPSPPFATPSRATSGAVPPSRRGPGRSIEDTSNAMRRNGSTGASTSSLARTWSGASST